MEFEVVVVGSGLAGLSAALAAKRHGLETVLIEKAPLLGGGTAVSTGSLWIGNNTLARRAGIADSRDETIAYMRFLAAGYAVEEQMLTYVDRANEALEYFLGLGIPLTLVSGLPDHYYDGAPGSKAEGRMLEIGLIEGAELGPWQHKIALSPYLAAGVNFTEIIRWGGRGNSKNWDPEVIADRKRRDVRGLGVGLVAQFLKRVVEAGVSVLTETAADRLIVEDGQVRGLIAKTGDGEVAFRARRGVVIAAGGYESDPRLVREYEGLSEDYWHTMFSPALTGDGLVMAAEIGAKVHTLPVNMNTFLGFRTPPKTPGGPPGFQTGNVGMVTFPHTLVVNRHGLRFGDESYFQDIVAASRRFDVWRHDYPNLPSWVIFDSNFREKYTFAGAPPGSAIPDWVARGDTIAELAIKLGIDPTALEKTLAQFNEHARFGKDPLFHRGEAAWARMFTGDLTSTTNPNLGPVDRAPYYGLRLVLSGGASAGLMTDPAARVLHVRGHAIPGLYASGNASACTDFGAGYQAGESLARGMVFSYLAVRHMVESAA